MPVRRREKLTAPSARVARAVLIAAAVLVAARSLATRLYDGDLWWILAHGREMFRICGVLSTEMFSHTLSGSSLINFEWLTELLFYGLWKMGGPVALIALKVVAGLGVAALLAGVVRQLGARGPWLFVLLWIGFWTLRPRLNERAELATLLALPLALLVVERARANPGFRGASLPLLFLTFVVAANAHGGWVFAPALIGLRALGEWWAREDRGNARYLALAAAVIAVAGLVNPYGPRVLAIHAMHLARLGGGLSNRDLIEEWKPSTIEDLPFFWLLYLLAIAALWVGFRRRERWTFQWSPAVLVFGLWGGHSYRNASLFVFVALPLLAAAGPALVATFRWPPERVRAAGWLLLAAFVAGKAPVLARPLPKTPVQWSRFPVGACEFIEKNDVRGRMFNTLGHGGYIAWALGPERKIFCDGRYLFFPLLRQMVEASLAGGFEKFIAEHGVDHAVIDHHLVDGLIPPGQGGDLRSLLPVNRWALVYWDDAAMVFLKREAKFSRLIDEREYVALTPFNPALVQSLSREGRARAFRELERHRREVGFSVFAAELRAILGPADAGGRR